jgi:hypothetical protein
MATVTISETAVTFTCGDNKYVAGLRKFNSQSGYAWMGNLYLQLNDNQSTATMRDLARVCVDNSVDDADIADFSRLQELLTTITKKNQNVKIADATALAGQMIAARWERFVAAMKEFTWDLDPGEGINWTNLHRLGFIAMKLCSATTVS